MEYFIRIIYDIKKYTYVTFFVHLYHRIRYLDIERLKAKKCHNLQMIHDSDSSEHGWWWLHVTLVVVTRLIEAELSNVADECLNAMLLQPSSDND